MSFQRSPRFLVGLLSFPLPVSPYEKFVDGKKILFKRECICGILSFAQDKQVRAALDEGYEP